MLTNERRAEEVMPALNCFGAKTEGELTAAIDLLTNLRHRAQQAGWDFDTAVRCSEDHFKAESR